MVVAEGSPYKTLPDVIAAARANPGTMTHSSVGDITFSFGNLALGMPLVKGKKLRAIAFSGDARVAEYPDIPVVAEPVKGFDFNDWSGMLAPAGTPPAIVAPAPARHLDRFGAARGDPEHAPAGADPVAKHVGGVCEVHQERAEKMGPASSLSDLGIVGCKSTAAVYFSPLSYPISRYWDAKSSKTILVGDRKSVV